MIPTEEQIEIGALARDFAAGEIRPHTAGWEEAREVDPTIYTKLGELGFMGTLAPEEHGGLDLDVPTQLLVLEALSWGDGSVGLGLGIHGGPVTHLLGRYGSPEQRARWLPLLASGKAIGALAWPDGEGGTGSEEDAAGIRMERAGEEWVLQGRRKWVTNGDRADLLIVFAGSDDDRGSAFLVSPTAPGYRVARREETLGLRAAPIVEIELGAVRLSDADVLGPVGAGAVISREGRLHGRVAVAALALGIAQAACEHAVAYALDRRQFQAALSQFGAIQEKVGEMELRLAASRALLLQVGVELEQARRSGADVTPALEARVAMAKVLASETAMWVSDEAVQIFGGYGYMRDYPVEKLMRDAKGTQIAQGANEVLRGLVARHAFGAGTDSNQQG